MTPKELIDLFDSKDETRVLPIFDYVSEHYPTFNHPKIDLGNEIFKALTELEELKRYPTSEEVCKEFSKSWGNPVRYDERHSLFEMYVGDNTWKPVELLRMRTVKSSLITLIGRFYEGMEKKDG